MKNKTLSDTQIERQTLLSTLAMARVEELETAINALPTHTDWAPLRGPEQGMIMVRGRIGGGGSPFNLGEATVSRASVKLSSGEVGHGYCLGTDQRKAELIAAFDALAQAKKAQEIISRLLEKVTVRLQSEQTISAQQAAATRVDFFTLVRGED